MVIVRTLFLLATLICLATPPTAWTSRVDVSSPLAASLSISSQAAFSSQIIRAIAKCDQSFSFGCALAAEAPSIVLPAFTVAQITIAAPEPPNLDLQASPLAPRPPPLQS